MEFDKHGQNSNDQDKFSNFSHHTVKEIEEEIEEKHLNPVVEEIISREKFKVHVKSRFSRCFKLCDNDEDEMIKKMRSIGIRKL